MYVYTYTYSIIKGDNMYSEESKQRDKEVRELNKDRVYVPGVGYVSGNTYFYATRD